MVATLTRIFGVHNLQLAEDVVQDAFCRALEVWKFRGMPDNPSAWLMATAKHRALDVLRRERTARTFAPELAYLLQTEWTLVPSDAGAVRARRHQRRPAAHDVFLLPSPRLLRGVAGRAGAAHLCAALAWTRSPPRSSAAMPRSSKRITRSKQVLAGLEDTVRRCGSGRFCRAPPMPCIGHFICYSMRGTTARRRNLRCASNCARKQCASPRCCSEHRAGGHARYLRAVRR
jgi:hypothetical protein